MSVSGPQPAAVGVRARLARLPRPRRSADGAGASRIAAGRRGSVSHRWLILAALSLAQLMVVLDATIVNIALPSAQHALGFSDANRQWIVTAYSLAFGSLLLLGGRLADLLGRKSMFLVGLSGFALASALGGTAQSFGVLVFARALQGAFGAMLAPASLSLLTTTFTDAKERSKAFGIFGAVAGAGGGIGLLLGGVLTEYLSWRWCLYVNVIIAVVAIPAGAILLRQQRAEHRRALDVPGTLTAIAGLVGVVFGLANAETAGWAAVSTWGFLTAGLVLLVGFVALQAKVSNPLLPLRIVLDRTRGGSLLAMGTVGAGMFGIFLFLTYYMSTILHYTPVQTGLAFLPLIGGISVSGAIAGSALLPRVGPKPVVPGGMLLAAAGMAWLSGIGLHSGYVTRLLPGLVVAGMGIGCVFSAGLSNATIGVRREDSGVASAMVNTMQQIGGSIGTALLSALAGAAMSGYLAQHVTGSPTATQLAQAMLVSYQRALWCSAGVFAAGALLAGLLLPRGVPVADPDAETVIAH